MTILSTQVFHQIPEDHRPELTPSENSLVSADGSSLNSIGEAIFNITVGQITVPHHVIVADISNDGLLGIDFLKYHEFSIDFKNSKLVSRNHTISANCKMAQQHRACRVTIAQHSIIPAGTRTIVQGSAAYRSQLL